MIRVGWDLDNPSKAAQRAIGLNTAVVFQRAQVSRGGGNQDHSKAQKAEAQSLDWQKLEWNRHMQIQGKKGWGCSENQTDSCFQCLLGTDVSASHLGLTVQVCHVKTEELRHNYLLLFYITRTISLGNFNFNHKLGPRNFCSLVWSFKKMKIK